MAITETVPVIARPVGLVELGSENPTNYFYCFASPVYKYVKWRWFYVRCPKLSLLCNSKSGAYVAATTVCSQQLWLNDFGQGQANKPAGLRV